MIPFDFEYYKPKTVKEAVGLFEELKSIDKNPMYYGGGTEIISMARMNNLSTGAVIDIKGIPDCNAHELKNKKLTIGSAITLTHIAEANLFPLLSLTLKRIADHTIQGKITLGGNLAGTIIYREAILPLMVANSDIILASIDGIRRVPLMDIFNKNIQLIEGEMIVKVIIDQGYLSMPYLHVKRTKYDKIDYPLITMAALINKNKINIAFSGLCKYPFRAFLIEEILNDHSISIEDRINTAIDNVPDKILSDISGSSEYRRFELQTILYEALKEFEVVN